MKDNLDSEKIHDMVVTALSNQDSAGKILNTLGEINAKLRYIPVEALYEYSRLENIPFAKLYGIVTSFSEFEIEPIGRHLILVCDGTACHAAGAENILQALEQKLGIKRGQTTPDGEFTLRAVYCVGSCGLAPIIIIDTKTFGRIRLREATNILEEYAESINALKETE